MKERFSPEIIALSKKLDKPLYAVGGMVRDYLIDKSNSLDVDLCSPCSLEEVVSSAQTVGIEIVAIYRRTGTAVLYDGESKYEYTCFRKDIYGKGGEHIPDLTVPTSDILEDALRRDFTCNAVYFDIKNGQFLDPLNGIFDIKNKTLKTVKSAKEVFSHDGLRLMRLARFTGELNFTPDKNTLDGARKNADKIKDISPERIFVELNKILNSDKKHAFSDKKGHYNGLKILEEIGVLEIILPELWIGKGMAQPLKYHKYDVLEHSLRTVLYADSDIRLSALLHDVGKPYCFNRDGNFYLHSKEGERIAQEILNRLKASNKEKEEVKYLIKYHMLPVDEMREEKLRLFIADNVDRLDKLIKIKKADFMALKDLTVPNNFLKRLTDLIGIMKTDGTPFTIKDLAISAKDLLGIGVEERKLGEVLKMLRDYCIKNPSQNKREKLLKMAENTAKNR